MEMKKNGYLQTYPKQQFDSTDNDDIVFEKDWSSDVFFKFIFINNYTVGSFSAPNDLIALIFDEPSAISSLNLCVI